ncbi:rCG47583 [Rattus norvegicus]|uniref:RCG47583 n=1 Tax=Rattus norvegicus TaxID=10116 RepID=A6HZP2_RAT|nr:rCG47583 [Rattus norvegicus]
MKGGVPCGRGGREFLGRKGNGRKSWAPPGRSDRRSLGPRGRPQ